MHKKILLFFILISFITFCDQMNFGHFDSVCDIEKIMMDNKIITLGKDDRVIVWDTFKKELAEDIDMTKFGAGYLSCLGISSDGKKFAVGSELGDVFIYDMEIDRIIFDFKELHKNQVTGIKFVQNNRKIVTSSYDGKINLIDISTTILKKQCIIEGEKITAIQITKNENEIVVGTDKGSVYFLDSKNLKINKSIPTIHSNWVTGIAFSSDEKMLATVGWDYKLQITSMTTKLQITNTYFNDKKALNSVDWSIDGNIAVTSSNGNIYLIKYDPEKARKERLIFTDNLNFHKEKVNKALFTNIGKTLISGGSDTNLIVWDVKNKRTVDIYSGF